MGRAEFPRGQLFNPHKDLLPAPISEEKMDEWERKRRGEEDRDPRCTRSLRETMMVRGAEVCVGYFGGYCTGASFVVETDLPRSHLPHMFLIAGLVGEWSIGHVVIGRRSGLDR